MQLWATDRCNAGDVVKLTMRIRTIEKNVRIDALVSGAALAGILVGAFG